MMSSTAVPKSTNMCNAGDNFPTLC